MAKLVANARSLKGDNVGLKGLATDNRVCPHCDSYALENAHHIVMQCPEYEEMREEMPNDMRALVWDAHKRCEEEPGMGFRWLLKKPIDGADTHLLT